jgi:hypothetical protein
MEGGRRAGGASDGDEFEGTRQSYLTPNKQRAGNRQVSMRISIAVLNPVALEAAKVSI